MKKILMRSVRAGLQLIPTSFKAKLKQNERLTGFYIRSVRKAGLFYDAPTAKQTQQLYDSWLAFQKAQRKGEADKPVAKWQAIIFGEKDLSATVAHVNELGALNCLCLALANEAELSLNPYDFTIPTLFIQGGDRIHPESISEFSCGLVGADLVYSDTDTINVKGKRAAPRFLPDWNPDLHFSTAYIRTGVFLESELLKSISLTVDSAISSVLTELVMCCKSLTIKHLPTPLIQHAVEANGVTNMLQTVKASLEKYTQASVVVDEAKMLNRIMWPNTAPLVSLIIPTKNGKSLVKACIESIREKTTYRNYEILLIDNGSDDPESLTYFEYLASLDNIRVLQYPFPFNYSAINNFGVEYARGSIIGLINNDIEVISPEWLNFMVGHVERKDVGCVGAKLLYSDTRIQHAGVVLGYGGGAGHAHKNFPRLHTGYLNRINATSNYSAVTAACLLVKKTDFAKVGGLNEKDLAVAFNDVDFCLKIRELGLNNVYCAEAELFHHESVSRGLDISPEKAMRFNRELSYLQDKWASYISLDPCYSPNLTLKRENFAIKAVEECMVAFDKRAQIQE